MSTYGRELSRLRSFSTTFGLPPVAGPADVGVFLSNESRVTRYIGYLANKGFAFASVRKILFSLRASTTAPDVPAPPPLSLASLT